MSWTTTCIGAGVGAIVGFVASGGDLSTTISTTIGGAGLGMTAPAVTQAASRVLGSTPPSTPPTPTNPPALANTNAAANIWASQGSSVNTVDSNKKEIVLRIGCQNGKIYEVRLPHNDVDQDNLELIKQAWSDILERLGPKFSKQGETFEITKDKDTNAFVAIKQPASSSEIETKQEISLDSAGQSKMDGLLTLCVKDATPEKTIHKDALDQIQKTVRKRSSDPQLLGIAPPRVRNQHNDCFLISAIHVLRASYPKITQNVEIAMQKAQEKQNADHARAFKILLQILREFENAQKYGSVVQGIQELRQAIQLLNGEEQYNEMIDQNGKGDVSDILSILLKHIDEYAHEPQTQNGSTDISAQTSLLVPVSPLDSEQKHASSIEVTVNDFLLGYQEAKTPPECLILQTRNAESKTQFSDDALSLHLNEGCFPDKPDSPVDYDLVAVVCSRAADLHYTTIVQGKNELGKSVSYLANDGSVVNVLSPEEMRELAQKEGILLIYRKHQEDSLITGA